MAEQDLEEIWLYTFKTWSQQQADAYHAGFVKAFGNLSTGHKTGQPVATRSNYMKYPVGSHVIFYRIVGDAIEVIRILHTRMDATRHLPV